jgi:hypothetical protein
VGRVFGRTTSQFCPRYRSPPGELKDSVSLKEITEALPDYFGKKQLTYLEDIRKSFPSDLRIFSAEGSSGQVALFALLCYRGRAALCAWFSFPGVSDKEKCLVIRYSMRWACEQGFHTYEIMDNKISVENQSFESFFDPGIRIRFRAEKYSTSVWKALNNARGVYN